MKSVSDSPAACEDTLTWEQLRVLCAPYFELPKLTPLAVARRSEMEEVRFNELQGRGGHAIQIGVWMEHGRNDWRTEAYVVVQVHEFLRAAARLMDRIAVSKAKSQQVDDSSSLPAFL